MNRRNFFELGAAAAAAGNRPKARLLAGTQHASTDEVMRTMPALGVTHISREAPANVLDGKWSADGLKRLREHVESCGLKLEMISLPTNGAFERAGVQNILLGRSPERDRELDAICQMIRNVAAAGIPRIKYNLRYLDVLRTESTPGRGGALYSTFDYARAKQEPPLTAAGEVSVEENWERIGYFLKRVIPVAAEYRIRMALHPHDPPLPVSQSFRGIHRVLGSVEGLKRFLAMEENPYHGLNFCQGTVAEMLDKPGEQIYDVIRYFASRGKIFNIHFRNIKGGFLKFQESFPDDGDVDMIRALRAYREAGVDAMVMPDHVPHIPGDEGSRQAFAFAIGYIAAVLELVRQEG
jgi:mannonate dehydratase